MDKIVKLYLVLTTLCGISFAEGEFYPSVVYQLDQKFNHHVLVVEKSTHSLYLYKSGGEFPQLLKKYRIMSGKFTGNKKVQGDKKTPEGIYFFQRFHSANFLLNKYGDYAKIYGAGAFTTNYPNPMDRRAGKTGSGIWLHSSDDDGRISLGLDSRGCVVAVDKDLKDISQYIDLKYTPMIITQNLDFQTRESWSKSKAKILELVNSWSKAWKEKDFNTYIDAYSKKEFSHPKKGRFRAFKYYKKAVFSREDQPTINFSHLSILNSEGYAVVTMEQDYSSPIIKDIGKKTLYLKKDEHYQWKIVAEEWSGIDTNKNIAFTPKMRYFSNESSSSQKDISNDSTSI